MSRVYFTRLQFIQLISHPSCLSPGFILTGIPFCCSESLISFACDLWVNPFWKFLRLENLAWDFWGLNFWSRDCFGFLGGPRDFFGFWFLPPFDHPCHLKSGSTPPGHETYTRRRKQDWPKSLLGHFDSSTWRTMQLQLWKSGLA